MIPKVIHYCWFGKNQLSPLHIACMETWKKYLPEYEIRRWDESNSPMDIPFIKYHYSKKNWAFVSDYVRLHALKNFGGIYLDVDFEVLKNLDPLLLNKCFLGEEQKDRITNGIFGGIKGHAFFSNSLEFMEKRHLNKQAIYTSPEDCTAVYKKIKTVNDIRDIKIST